jgi:hypothetical protein
MRQFGLLCVCAVTLLSACSDDKDDQNTNPLNPGGGAGGTTSGAAGSGGAAGTAGAGGAGTGNGEGGQPSGIAGSAQAPDNGNGGAPPADGDAGEPPPSGDAGADTSMSFFVTSRGGPDGGNFGGLAGADALCTTLATAANPALASKTWRAYLSTSEEDARDRIGSGPWRNFNGVIIANDLQQLHDQGPAGQGGTLDQTWLLANTAIPLDETGAIVPSGGGNNLHDILTGSNLDGTASANTCSDWTATTGQAQNGHSNRAGGGQNPPSWNSAHATGCAPATANGQQGTVSQGGGRGSIYCFATN